MACRLLLEMSMTIKIIQDRRLGFVIEQGMARMSGLTRSDLTDLGIQIRETDNYQPSQNAEVRSTLATIAGSLARTGEGFAVMVETMDAMGLRWADLAHACEHAAVHTRAGTKPERILMSWANKAQAEHERAETLRG